MFWRFGGLLFLVATLQLQAVAQEPRKITLEDQLKRPFVELFSLTLQDRYTDDEVKSIRSTLEKERARQIETSQTQTKRYEHDLVAARQELVGLNDAGSRDTPETALRRNDLHRQITQLERDIRDAKDEREIRIPLAYELKLAKLRVVQRWPERRAEIDHKIGRGLARSRKYGDVEDIGYRKWVKDQDKDVAVGEQTVREMTANGSMPQEARQRDVQDYVRGLATQIARNSDLKVPLQVSVLDNPAPRAIALPGGFLFVTTGLITSAQQESELVAVLSREIGKMAARHGTRASKRSIIPKLFVPAAQVATGFLTGGASSAGMYYSMNYGFQGLGTLMDRAFTGTSEKSRKEADQLGIQYTWKAGFDPRGFIAFIDTVSLDKDAAKAAAFFDKRAKFEKRILDVFSEIAYLPPAERPFADSVDFKMAKWSLTR